MSELRLRVTYCCLANNVGSTGGRYWFGYVFRGGPTTPNDYVRDSDEEAEVEDSAVYTISFEDEEEFSESTAICPVDIYRVTYGEWFCSFYV